MAVGSERCVCWPVTEIPDNVMNARSPIGAAGDLHSTTRRSIRWQQQSLKALGVLERVEGARGVWQLTEKAKKGLNTPSPGVTLLGFSTNLGLALWGTSPDALAGLYEPIELVLTSPPFPLRISRAYGNPTASEFVDFICQVLEPIVPKISATGSLVLNMTNDSFLEKSPGRSTYLERTIIALEDRLGLTLMDRVPMDKFVEGTRSNAVVKSDAPTTQCFVGTMPVVCPRSHFV